MSNDEEEIFFFQGSAGRNLLGFLHRPAGKMLSLGIVYCHPFAEEKNCSHTITVEAARAFAAAGFWVLRFDLSGCGDSEGELEEIRLNDWLLDLHAAVVWLRTHSPVQRIIMWGLRLGANLCLRYTSLYPDICLLLLWQPLVDGAGYIRQFMRRNVHAALINARDANILHSLNGNSGEAMQEIVGYTLSANLIKDINDFGTDGSKDHFAGSIAIFSISLMAHPSNALLNLIGRLRTKGDSLYFDAIQAEPFWDRYWCWTSPVVVEKTARFLNNYVQEL